MWKNCLLTLSSTVFFLVLGIGITASGLFAEEPKGKAAKNFFMFVQSAKSGELISVEGKSDTYVLTLYEISPQVIYFSDRPERIVGHAEMAKFLKGLGFSDKNPPNAAIQLLAANQQQDTIVVELMKPHYDETKRTLQYEIKILQEAEKGLAVFTEKKDGALPAKFNDVSLFIDDCQDFEFPCCNGLDAVGYIGPLAMCWSWSDFSCEPCHDDPDADCNSKYPSCNGNCDVGGLCEPN